jgi:DNA repair exonuclease SbcCD nuclease subunit
VLELALPDIRFHTEYLDQHDRETFAGLDLIVHAIPHGALTNPDPVMPRVFKGHRNMMVVHGIVPGIIPAGIQTEPGEQLLDHNLLDERYDYIALGHIHQSQQVSPNAWYSGSMERFGWGDAVVDPGYLMVTLGEPGEPVSVEHVSIPGRPMISLRPVRCEGKEADAVVAEVVAQLEKRGTPDAMARVELKDAPRPLRREVQIKLRREAEAYVWSIDLAPERIGFMPGVEASGEVDDATLDLHALFREFVDSRKSTYPSEAFTTMLLERGSQALTDAMVAEAETAPEDDSLS